MKLSLCAAISTFLLLFANIVLANDDANSLFLYSITEVKDDSVNTTIDEALVDSSRVSELPIELEYQHICDIKCGVNETGLALLHMVVESKAYQEYRYSLMNPNYEP